MSPKPDSIEGFLRIRRMIASLTSRNKPGLTESTARERGDERCVHVDSRHGQAELTGEAIGTSLLVQLQLHSNAQESDSIWMAVHAQYGCMPLREQGQLNASMTQHRALRMRAGFAADM